MAVSAKRLRESLLQDVKDKLRVTWTEDDVRIGKLIEAAQADLNGLYSKCFDYNKAGKPRTLMLEHVFYNWNNSLHEFRELYRDELTELSLLVVSGGFADAPNE